MIVIKIDFDDMGTMWSKKFEQEVGEEFNDLDDKHCEIFDRIQKETRHLIESQLFEVFEETIVLEYELLFK